MTFGNVLGEIWRSPFGPAVSAAAAVSWWLSGGLTAGDWVSVYDPAAAATLALSYDDKISTNDAAPGVAPTHAAGTGWIFNGTNQYLTCGIVLQKTWSAFVKFNYTGGPTDRMLFGSFDGAVFYQFQPRYSDGLLYSMWGSFSSLYSQTGITGVHTIAIAAGVFYLDGTFAGSSSNTTNAILDMFIGCRRTNTSPGQYFVGSISHFGIANRQLTAPEVAALHAAV